MILSYTVPENALHISDYLQHTRDETHAPPYTIIEKTMRTRLRKILVLALFQYFGNDNSNGDMNRYLHTKMITIAFIYHPHIKGLEVKELKNKGGNHLLEFNIIDDKKHKSQNYKLHIIQDKHGNKFSYSILINTG